MTVKQRFKEALTHDVSVDYFLYSCLEQERTLRAVKNPPEFVWPRFESETPNLEDKDLEGLVSELFAWYVQTSPAISASEPVNHERLTEVTPAVVRLIFDLSRLVELKSGAPVPEFVGTAPQQDPFWDLLERAMRKHLPKHADLYMPYAQWCFRNDPVEELIPGSRPPVGRYAPSMRSRYGSSSKPGDRGRGGDRGGGDRGRPPRNDGPPRGGRPPRNDGPDRGPRHEGSSDRPPRGDSRPHSDRPRGPRSDNRRPENDRTGEQADMALKDVDAAIGVLQKDPGIKDYTLKPANSFYRRLQHEHIKKNGFYSASTGEGPDRAVLITRERSANSGD